MITHGLQFSGAKDLNDIRPESNLTGPPTAGGWVKIGDFRQTDRSISKTMQDSRIVSTKVEYEVVCALSNGNIAHDLDCPVPPNHPKPPHFLHFAPPFIAS